MNEDELIKEFKLGNYNKFIELVQRNSASVRKLMIGITCKDAELRILRKNIKHYRYLVLYLCAICIMWSVFFAVIKH